MNTVGPADWGDKPVYIVGGGPSLTPFKDKLATLHEKGYVLAVNEAFRFCNPHVIFSIDTTWIKNRHEELGKLSTPVFIALDESQQRYPEPNITYILWAPRSKAVRLSTNPSFVTNGLNSGFCALNFAFLKGAKTIYLLGIDLKPGENRQTHFHSGYDWHKEGASVHLYKNWSLIFEAVAPQLREAGVVVWNCSNSSILKGYPHKPYAEVL